MKKFLKGGFFMLLCAALIFSMSPLSVFLGGGSEALADEGSGLAPGGLSIAKKAIPVEGKSGIWDMKLELSVRDLWKTADIVMVMDTSGSMKSFGRMDAAKDAAKSFVDNMIKEADKNHTRISVVSFAPNATINKELTNDVSKLKEAIDGLVYDGGTHTQAGIYQAELVLKDSSADNKVIVLLSDGEPTYSYDVQEGYVEYSKKFGGDNDRSYETTDALPYDLVNQDSSIGDGRNIRAYKQGELLSKKYYINHGNMAIVEANHAKENGIKIYAIGLSLKDDGRRVLQKIGTDGRYYDAEPAILKEIYDNTAGRVIYGAINALVTDPIGEMFDMVDSNADGTVDGGDIKVYDNKGKELAGSKVTWHEADDEHKSGYFTVDLKEVTEAASDISIEYQVKIKDDAVSGQEYPTNGRTTIEYTNSTGQRETKDFIVPKVSIIKEQPSKPKKPKPDPDQEKPPVTPPSEPPSKPETPPSEPPVTPPTTPETPPNEPPVAPPTTPRYPPSNPPDPNDPDSPEIIEVIGDDGVPLGKYKKVPNDDGGFEYIDEEGIPLGSMKLVATGNDFPASGLVALSFGSLAGISLLIAARQRKQKNQMQ